MEFQGAIYRHIVIPVWAIFSVGSVVAACVAPRLLRPRAGGRVFEDALRRTELFVLRDPPRPVTVGKLVRSFVTEPLLVPLHLLLPPALIVMIMSPESVTLGFGLALAAAWIALVFGGLHDRFNAMWMVLQEAFFRGGALLVSVLVVALAAARLWHVSYVSTVLDGVQGLTVVLYVGAAYVLFWWYDYWTTRLASQHLLGQLGAPARGEPLVAYAIDPGAVRTAVPADHRVVQVHGAGRFVVVRPPQVADPPGVPLYFHTYGNCDIIRAITEAISCDEPRYTRSGLGRTLPSYAEEARYQCSELGKQLFSYGALITAAPALLLGGWALVTSYGPQHAQIAVGRGGGAGVAVADLLFDPSRCGRGRPAIAIAASGGGTRAALYTASVLAGLQGLGRLEDVRLGSGVSGGGAALAYFAAHRQRLITGDEGAWRRFFEAMSEPFIQDVLNGAAQWRIARATRLGALLTESFERRWQAPPDRRTLADVKELGLILNTALAGELDRRTLPLKADDSGKSLTDLERTYRRYTRSDLAGGRLIFTNLLLPDGYQGAGIDPGGALRLPIVIVHDPQAVSLANAAALNANFPPVFPNAGVDVADTRRYWVTDGGAIDNRGMETLL
jgi:hypothetical protein